MSSHVDEDTLTFLKASPERGIPWLDGFYKQHWGKPNGAIVPIEDGGSTRAVLCIKNSFDVLRRSPLLVRRTYKELWDYLCKEYIDAPKEPRFGTLVFGHPGMGKTVSLYYLMCAAAERRVPFVFHRISTPDSTHRALVCIDAGSFFIQSKDIETLNFTAPVLILIDSAEHHSLNADVYKVPMAHVVLTSSPAPVRYRQFMKEQAALYYTMNLVDDAEFRDILFLRTLPLDTAGEAVSLTSGEVASLTAGDTAPTEMDVDLDLSAEYWSPQEVFDICGPNLRWALLPHPRITGTPDEILPRPPLLSALSSIALAANALAGVKSVRDLGDGVATGFSTFFFEQPDPRGPVSTNPPFNTTIPTPFLRGVLHAAVRQKQHHEQLELLSRVKGFGVIHGVVFEGVVLDYLATAPLTAVLPPRPSSAPSSLAATVLGIVPQNGPYPYLVTAHPPDVGPSPSRRTATPLAYTGNAQRLSSIDDALGFCALPPGFASADAIMLAQSPDGLTRFEIAFQVTISKARPIKKREIESIAKALSAHSHGLARRRLFVFVSESESLAFGSYPYLSGWEVGHVTVTEEQVFRLE